MTEAEARLYVRSLSLDGRGFNATAGVQWKDPLHVATDVFRQVVVAKLSREPIYDTSYGEGPYGGVALIELYLTEELPDIQWFYGIFTVDDFGIWFTDQGANIETPAMRQHVIAWRFIKGMVIHQRT